MKTKSDIIAVLQHEQWSSRDELMQRYLAYQCNSDEDMKELYRKDLERAYRAFETLERVLGKALDDKDFLKAIQERPIPCSVELEILKIINADEDYGGVSLA